MDGCGSAVVAKGNRMVFCGHGRRFCNAQVIILEDSAALPSRNDDGPSNCPFNGANAGDGCHKRFPVDGLVAPTIDPWHVRMCGCQVRHEIANQVE